jgi:succinate--hydroxymethylglutarate CoA-transferase
MMLRSSRRFLAAPSISSQCHWRSIARRGIATTPTASGDASNLPLAGIKVLDMTRVLAGVSMNPPTV